MNGPEGKSKSAQQPQVKAQNSTQTPLPGPSHKQKERHSAPVRMDIRSIKEGSPSRVWRPYMLLS